MIIFPSGITISDADAVALQHDLISIEDWVSGAIRGKINNCRKRLTNQWLPILLNDPDIDAIEASPEGFIQQVISHRLYANRVEREAGDGRTANA